MTKADLHCRSAASAVARLGLQQAVGRSGCAAPPEKVYSKFLCPPDAAALGAAVAAPAGAEAPPEREAA